MSFLGKSNHFIMEMEVKGEIEGYQREKYEESRRNYEWTTFVDLKGFVSEENWKYMKDLDEGHQKMPFFDIHEMKVKKCAMMSKIREENYWFNRFETAKKTP